MTKRHIELTNSFINSFQESTVPSIIVLNPSGVIFMKNKLFIDQFTNHNNVVGLKIDYLIKKLNGSSLSSLKYLDEDLMYT